MASPLALPRTAHLWGYAWFPKQTHVVHLRGTFHRGPLLGPARSYYMLTLLVNNVSFCRLHRNTAVETCCLVSACPTPARLHELDVSRCMWSRGDYICVKVKYCANRGRNNIHAPSDFISYNYNRLVVAWAAVVWPKNMVGCEGRLSPWNVRQRWQLPVLRFSIGLDPYFLDVLALEDE